MPKLELTEEFVKKVRLGSSKEAWYGDTIVPGFGLRLWKNKKGEGRCFGLRYKNEFGHFTRRTFHPITDAEPYGRFSFGMKPWGKDDDSRIFDETRRDDLGYWVQVARQWALDTKTHKASKADEEMASNESLFQREQNRQFEASLTELIQETYKGANRDYYHSLIASIPNKFLKMSVKEIKAKPLLAELISQKIDFPRLQAIRAVLSRWSKKMHIRKVDFDARHNSAFFHQQSLKAYSSHNESIGSQYLEVKDRLLKIIERDAPENVHASFLKVYFETRTKQAPPRNAKWDQLIDNYFVPYLPKERNSWDFAVENLSDDLLKFLETYRAFVRREFGDTEFIFPSKLSNGTFAPITSAQRYFGRCMKQAGWNFDVDGLPQLKIMAEICKHRRNPSLKFRDNLISHVISQKLETELADLKKALPRKAKLNAKSMVFQSMHWTM